MEEANNVVTIYNTVRLETLSKGRLCESASLLLLLFLLLMLLFLLLLLLFLLLMSLLMHNRVNNSRIVKNR